MSIEAIGAMEGAMKKLAQSNVTPVSQPSFSQATQKAQPVDMTTISMRPTQVSSSNGGDFASQLGGRVYETIDQLGVRLPGIGDTKSMAVDKAKQQLASQNDTLVANPGETKPTGNDSLVQLSQTFDHAVFMAMVNQVISGVSDSARTLIRQT